MTAAEAGYRRLLSDLTVYLTDRGFAADGRIFRSVNAAGDMVIVEVQISSGSDGNRVLFYLNTALILAPKWAWDRRRLGLPDDRKPTSANGSWRDRVGPPGQRGTWRWEVYDDVSAVAVADEIRTHLDLELPVWTRFLDREVLLRTAAEEGNMFKGGAWNIRAWLLADQPGNEDVIEEILNGAGIPADHAARGPLFEHARRAPRCSTTRTLSNTEQRTPRPGTVR